MRLAAIRALTVMSALASLACSSDEQQEPLGTSLTEEQVEQIDLTVVNQFGGDLDRTADEWARFIDARLCVEDQASDELIDHMREIVDSSTGADFSDTDLLAIAYQLIGIACPA